VEHLLREVCARNAPAELHHETPEGSIITCHCRLLKLSGDRILTDEVIYADLEHRIPRGGAVTAYVSLLGCRYQFQSTVEDNAREVSGTDCRRATGLTLRKPTSVDDSQRRAGLRLALAPLGPVEVVIVSCHPGADTACPIDAEPIHGQMVNISVGGASVTVDQGVLGDSGRMERVYLTFRLPGEPEEFCMLGCLRHAQTVEEGEALRIGYRFRPWCRQGFLRSQQRIARFIEQHEQHSRPGEG